MRERDAMYQVERTSDVQSLLAESGAAWDRLSGGVPLRESSWLGNWWQVFGDGHEGYVVTVRDSQGTLCGLLPLYRHETDRTGRTLSGMGDDVTCTDYFSVLAREEDAAAIAAEIGRWLARVSRDEADGWDLIDLDGIVGGDCRIAALVDALRSEGAVSHATSRMGVWLKTTEDTWEEYLARLSKTHRRKSRRHLKNLDAGDPLTYHTATTREEVRLGLDVLIDQHQRRWTAVGQPGSFADPRSRDFLHAAAQDLFDRDLLKLCWLEHDERPIASEMRIVGHDRVMYCYTTGMDKDYARFEPGRVLNIQGLHYAYEQGLRGVDYLRGDESYKQRLLATARPLIRLRIVAPSLLPRLRHAAWLTQFEVKQFIRRHTGRVPERTLSVD